MAKLKHVALLLVLLLSAMGVQAQVTTSSLSGKVTDKENLEVIGASVKATHTPSGTQYTAITNINGQFNIQGMRVGGPYTVEVSYIGYETKKISGITLQLAENTEIKAVLGESAELLNEIVVVGRGTKFNQMKTGAATNITQSMIAEMPTVSRSITDYTRLSPYGGNGMTFGGSDGRTANFTVDGADFNNNFGLSDKLPGGGNPISIEAIQEIQVVVSPYDVRQTNFIGGGVNAVTKSGTNEFQGTAYVYHQNENMRGSSVDGTQITTARDKDRKTTYGFTLGGPIIKNKLFFFANYEASRVPTQVNRWRANGNTGISNVTDYLSRTKESDLQSVSDYAKSKYGYDTGSYNSFPADEKTDRYMARLDWNINNNHRVALRYNYTKNLIWNSPNGTSMDGGARMPSYRMSDRSMSFANSMYSMENISKSWSFDLNSRFSNNIQNQLLATYSQHDDIRGTNSADFPFIDILDGDITGGAGEDNYIALGYELFTYNNGVHNNVLNIKDDVNIDLGKHKLLVGAYYEHQMADNAYMRNGTGYYRYNSVSDFLNGAAPETVCLTYGYGDEKNPAARVTFNKAAVYAQDNWTVNDKFKLNLGIRFDGLFFDNKDLMTNNAILDLDYNGRHIDTGKWPSAGISISPRIGFTYDVLGDKSLTLRGGTGFFSGRIPLVFFTNMPTNGGMVQYQAQLTAKKNDLSKFAGGLIKEEGKSYAESLKNFLVQNYGMPATITPDQGSKPSAVNGVDSKFKMPQVWKTSLALDYQFPTSFPLMASVEGVFTKTLNDVCISDWSINPVGGYARFNGADNRPIYPDNFRSGTKAFVLENTNKGYGFQGNITLKSNPTKWLSLEASYTHTVKKELTSMPGSAAESAFTYVPTVEGPNNIRLHNALNVTPNRYYVKAAVHDKNGNHFSALLEGFQASESCSYMMQNDMNGDGYNYDAVYIPTDAQVANGEFRFKTQDDADRFMAYVHNSDYLKGIQGKYTEAYSVYKPWVHRVDVSYKHDFKFKVGPTAHKFQLSADVKNLMNLFKSSWGVMKGLDASLGSSGAARILKYEGVDKEGYATFSTPKAVSGKTETFTFNHAISQCWYMSIGIKYFFN
ncbi:MAG: TonB-dependent receptor [Bacteroidaceae bacterium]|nr:TonB-dependent receptor [Bacteroidaceae bacterium]